MNARRLSFAELHQEVLEALRSQNPNWVQPDGASPIYDNYEARLTELLGLGSPSENGESQVSERNSG
ncbi:hypothetical protein DES53_112138 [Roseimicrobium gellanilyticum]|uniref:Uncharacterized protein n=1 Tax=Roseimicrobium gellanilyticum TaxID=748857 RepID=A0A366H7K9_9BACT|nr:hypothetical protein [Roseimicrobium gellanilyticum]RBP38140.1 hypothetical protein DES53_112138 [Roseimicrobium gellanilyticum]